MSTAESAANVPKPPEPVTKVFVPNPEASHEEYVSGFGLTEREFGIISRSEA